MIKSHKATLPWFLGLPKSNNVTFAANIKNHNGHHESGLLLTDHRMSEVIQILKVLVKPQNELLSLMAGTKEDELFE